MVTKESLKEQYSKLLTEHLLEIAKNKTGYTELANSVALEELKHRRVPAEVVAQYDPVTYQIDEATKENCLIDLDFLKKGLYFYVMWIPAIKRLYNPHFMKNGYILKSNQSNYYTVVGFLSLIITISLNISYHNSAPAFFLIWTMLFGLSYLFDICFNKERQIKNIRKVVDKGTIPWGF